ncbi:MAG: mechanosensitive ion channel family protein [Methanoregula sp.]|jgi:small-conductance mechanosensitive channel
MDTELLDSIIYLGIGIIAAGIVHIIFIWLKKKAEQTETKMDDLLVYSLGWPLVMLAFFIPFFLAIEHLLSIYPQLQWIADSKVLASGYILVGTWIIATFVDGFLNTYGMALAEETETDLDDRIVEILQKIAKWIIWFIGFMYILSTFNINITPLIAGAGIMGIAIALAAQDLFSNFFGGAVIITDQPFKAGDRVLINDVLGDVIHIGPRSTRIITLDSDIVTMPNTKIATSIIHNYSMPNPQVRIQIPVSVSYAADINQVKRVLSEIIDEAVKTRPDVIAPDPKPTVYLMKMDKSTMTFMVTVFASGFLYNNIIQDYMNIQIVERFRKEGIIIS